MDLLVRGGTVVTAAGSRRADVLVDAAGRSPAVLVARGWRAGSRRGRRGRRGRGPPRPAGRRRRPHPHPGRQRRRARSVLPGHGRGGLRRDDHAARLQQPGDRIVAGGRAVARDRDARVASGGCRRRRRRRRPQPRDQRADGRPGGRAGGDRRRGRADGQGLHGLRLPAGRPTPLRGDAAPGRGGRHAPGPLRGPGPHRRRRGRSGPAGSTPTARPCRQSNPRSGGRRDAPGDGVRPGAGRRSMSSTSRRPRRSRRSGGRRLPAFGPRPKPARTTWSSAPIATTGPTTRRSATSYRRHCGRRLIATRCGRAWPTARSTSSPATTSRTGSRSRSGPRRRRSRRSATARRGSKRSSPVVYSEGVARGRITVERMVDLLATTPARRFGLAAKGAIEPGRDADLVLFDPAARRDDPRRGPPPHERLHPVRGLRRIGRGPVGVRARPGRGAGRRLLSVGGLRRHVGARDHAS